MRKMKMRALLVLASLAVVTFPAYARPAYVGITFPSGPYSGANGLSNTGTVVGCSPGQPTRAWRWNRYVMTMIGPGCAQKVNDNDDVAGISATGELQAWWADGTVVSIGGKGLITGINNARLIVGTLQGDDGLGHAFRWRAGERLMLPEFGSTTGSRAVGVNNRGQILLWAGDRVFVYDDATGAATEIPRYDPNTPLRPAAINDQGTVVGTGRCATTWRWPNGMPSANSTSCGYSWGVSAMNNKGQLVTEQEPGATTRFGYVEVYGSWHVSGLAINDREWVLGRNGDGTSMLFIPDWDVALPLSPAVRARRTIDFNQDGREDLAWYHSDTLQQAAWTMNGATITSGFSFAHATGGDTSEPVVGRGRGGSLVFVTNDGGDASLHRLRLVASDGSTETATFEGDLRIFAGFADFDGDGQDDILWWTLSGYEAWLMDGVHAKAVGPVSSPPSSRHAAIADFDGDGRDDILWLGDDGHAEMSLMNGLAATPAGVVRPAGTGFLPLVIGDFNGDGKADLVWKHDDGRHSVWLMDGARMINSAALLDANTSTWTVNMAADLDGDGKDDLLWHTDWGAQAGWLMDGTTPKAYRNFLSGNWRVLGAADIDGNGTADLIWQNLDGSYGVWLMQGLEATSYGSLLGPNRGWLPLH